MSISARNNGGLPTSLKTIPMTVISVPAGASLKVDDKDEGLTPARINVGIGTHQLELKKEGFAVATTPLEVYSVLEFTKNQTPVDGRYTAGSALPSPS